MFQQNQQYFLTQAQSYLDNLDLYNDLAWRAHDFYACRHQFYPAVEWAIRFGRADRLRTLVKVWNAAGYLVCPCNSVKLIVIFF